MQIPRLEEHLFRVMENHLRLSEVATGCDWQLSLEAEVLAFYRPDSGKVVLDCPIQLVGTEDERTQTWLWAWANAGSDLPAGTLEAVNRLKKAAVSAGADDFYQNENTFPYPRPTFGAEMAILTAGVSDGFTTFRCPYEGGAAYIVIESCPKAAKLPNDPMRIGKAILEGITHFTLDHRAAITAYLGEPDAEGVYRGGIKIDFDAQGRVGNVEYTLTPEAAPAAPPKPVSPLERLKGLFRRDG